MPVRLLARDAVRESPLQAHMLLQKISGVGSVGVCVRVQGTHACALGNYVTDIGFLSMQQTSFGLFGPLSDVTILRPNVSIFHVHSRFWGVAH